MQKNPVDDVLNKIIAELLKKNDFEGVSRIALNSLTDLVKECRVLLNRLNCSYSVDWPRCSDDYETKCNT